MLSVLQRPGVARFVAAYRTELRQVVWGWVYPALWVGMALFTAGFANVPSLTSAGMFFEVIATKNSTGLLGLLAMFMGGLSATRNARTRFDALEGAYPVGLEVFLARWAANLTAMLPFLIPPLVVAAGIGPAALFAALTPVFLAEAIITIGFSSALAYALIAWIGPRRWVFLLLPSVWLAFSLGMVTVNVPGVELFNFGRISQVVYTDLWGRDLWGALPTAFNIFYGGLILALVAALSWRLIRQRFRRRSLPALAMFAGAVAVIVTGGGAFFATSASAENRSFLAPQLDGVILEPKALPFAISRYEIDVEMSDPALPRYTTTLTLVNRGTEPLREVPLTLNAQLRVMEVSAPYTRQADSLMVQLPEALAPGRSYSLTLRYEGTLNRMLRRLGAVYATDFTAAHGVRLSFSAVWYPQAGRFPVLIDMGFPPKEPAAVRLTVRGSGLDFASNLPPVATNGPDQVWEAQSASMIHLIGAAELAREQVGMFTLIGRPFNVERVRETVQAYYVPAWEHIKRFFPAEDVTGALILLDDLDEGRFADGIRTDGIALFRGPVTAIMAMSTATWYQDFFIGGDVAAAMLNGNFGLLSRELANFLWVHYQHKGDLSAMRQTLGEDPLGIRSVFMDIYAAEGESGLIAYLAKLQPTLRQTLFMAPPEIKAHLEGVRNAR